MKSLIFSILFFTAFSSQVYITDYAVIGAGTAGSVAGKELSDDPHNKVFVLEQGEDWSNIVDDTVGFYKTPFYGAGDDINLFQTKYAFADYLMSQETTSSHQSYEEPIAELMGGSQSINGNAFNRLSAEDLSQWNSQYWTYEATLDDWKELETAIDADPIYHGTSGPITTNRFEPDEFVSAINKTMVEDFNGTYNSDLNSNVTKGVGLMFRNIGFENGKPIRQTAYNQILRPVINRDNLHIMKNSYVTRIIPGKYGVGHRVEFHYDNEIRTLYVMKEIVISAGAYGSPHILQLSGIGDCDELEEVGVKCIHHNPEVGRNLREIVLGSMVYAASRLPEEEKPGPILSNYYRSSYYTGQGEDMELSLASLTSGGVPIVVHQLAQLKHGGIGFVKPKSSSPFAHPFFTTNIWKNESDIAPLVEQFKYIRNVMATTSNNNNFTFFEVKPGYTTIPPDASDAQIAAYLKTIISAGIHTTGTCSMHKVVNEKLELIGIPGIRVLDNSIIPTEMSSHSTSAVATLIGKVGARLILEN
jgi:choline dehydrogenase